MDPRGEWPRGSLCPDTVAWWVVCIPIVRGLLFQTLGITASVPPSLTGSGAPPLLSGNAMFWKLLHKPPVFPAAC